MENEILSFLFKEKEEVLLNINGLSMGREVARHGSIYVCPIVKPPQIGDILLIKLDKNYVVHRLISQTKKNLITKGDNCVSADNPINQEDIIGLVKGLVKDNALWVPWHWRQPLAFYIALWSRLEAKFWKNCRYPFVIVRKLRYIIR